MPVLITVLCSLSHFRLPFHNIFRISAFAYVAYKQKTCIYVYAFIAYAFFFHRPLWISGMPHDSKHNFKDNSHILIKN